MTFQDWFKKWMQGHPLPVPSENDSRRFTQDVMRQIRADIYPAHATDAGRSAWSCRRLALAVPSIAIVTAMLVVAVLYFTRDQGPSITKTPPPSPAPTTELVEPELVEPMQIAQAAPIDDAETILAILTALDEDIIPEDISELPPDALAEALRWIDEADLSS